MPAPLFPFQSSAVVKLVLTFGKPDFSNHDITANHGQKTIEIMSIELAVGIDIRGFFPFSR
jgi:hypothetical protein